MSQKQIKFRCLQCGKEFISRKRGRKFCSVGCCLLYRTGKSTKPKLEVRCLICGKPFKIWPSRLGKRKYCSKECRKIGRSEFCQQMKLGYRNPRWKGSTEHRGRYKGTAGYILINVNALEGKERELALSMVPDSQKQSQYRQSRYIREHRLIIAKSIGRPLQSNEVVHHKNGVRNDNRLENLERFLVNSHRPGINCIECPECGYKWPIANS